MITNRVEDRLSLKIPAALDVGGDEAQDVVVPHQHRLVDLRLSEPAHLGSGDMISSLKVGWSSGGNRKIKIDVSTACLLFCGEKKCKMNKQMMNLE